MIILLQTFHFSWIVASCLSHSYIYFWQYQTCTNSCSPHNMGKERVYFRDHVNVWQKKVLFYNLKSVFYHRNRSFSRKKSVWKRSFGEWRTMMGTHYLFECRGWVSRPDIFGGWNFLILAPWNFFKMAKLSELVLILMNKISKFKVNDWCQNDRTMKQMRIDRPLAHHVKCLGMTCIPYEDLHWGMHHCLSAHRLNCY